MPLPSKRRLTHLPSWQRTTLLPSIRRTTPLPWSRDDAPRHCPVYDATRPSSNDSRRRPTLISSRRRPWPLYSRRRSMLLRSRLRYRPLHSWRRLTFLPSRGRLTILPSRRRTTPHASSLIFLYPAQSLFRLYKYMPKAKGVYISCLNGIYLYLTWYTWSTTTFSLLRRHTPLFERLRYVAPRFSPQDDAPGPCTLDKSSTLLPSRLFERLVTSPQAPSHFPRDDDPRLYPRDGLTSAIDK